MKSNEITNWIFDFDGTLVDSSNEIIFHLEKTYTKAGIKFESNLLNSNLIGPPLAQMFKILSPGLDSIQIDYLVKSFRKSYFNSSFNNTSLFYGVKKTLEFLKSKNCKLFIATYKPQEPTLKLIKKFGIDFFDDVITVDLKAGSDSTKYEMINHIIKKHNLISSDTAMLGDAISDITAANEANIYSIAAMWGYEKDTDTIKSRAKSSLYKFEQLKDVFYDKSF